MKQGYVLLVFVGLIFIGAMAFLLSLKNEAAIEGFLEANQRQINLSLYLQSFREHLKTGLKEKQVVFNHSNFANFSMRFEQKYLYKAVILRVENDFGIEIYWVDIFGIQEEKTQKYSISFQSLLYL